jgi:hypothetical protein
MRLLLRTVCSYKSGYCFARLTHWLGNANGCAAFASKDLIFQFIQSVRSGALKFPARVND